MRAYVFTDAALAPVAARFVWLSVDTEKEQNQNFLDRYPIESWPSLFVIDPQSGQVVRKWLGSVTAPELATRLSEAADAIAKGGPANEDFARASKLAAAQDTKGAVEAYRKALAEAPADWPSRPQAIEGLSFALSMLHDDAACVKLTQDELPRLPRDTALANVASTGLSCAVEAPKDSEARAAAPALDKVVDQLAHDEGLKLLADDRSGLYGTLVDARKELGDPAGAKQAARDWASFLEGEAAKAQTPDARAVFDPHRLAAYVELGEPEKAVAMLQESEKDLPSDYNPPTRLASVYLKLKRPQDALAEIQRAEKLVYGPRTLSVLLLKARVYDALGDKQQVKATLDHAEQFVDALPKPQQAAYQKKAIADARQKLLGS
jgi:hypothetical protein